MAATVPATINDLFKAFLQSYVDNGYALPTTGGGGGGVASNNITQVAGTAVDVNSGNKSAGTLRVVLATDQPSLPLPTGAATDASLTNGTAKSKISDAAGNALTSTSGALDVNIKTPATLPVSATALPLPTGAATDASLTGGNAKTKITDTAGTSITSTGNALDVNIKTSATLPVSAAALPLPTGAATDAVAIGGTAQSKLTNGTNVADVNLGDAGQNGLIVNGARKEVTFTTTTAQAVAQVDAGMLRFVSVHIVTQGGSSTTTFQTSNDNVNWSNQALITTSNTGTSGGAVSPTTTGVFCGVLGGRYFRINVTGIVSGTTAGVVEFSAIGASPFQGLTAVQGASTYGGSLATTGLQIGSKASNTPPAAVSNNQFVNLMSDLLGKLVTSPYTIPENMVQGTTAAITTTGSTQVLAAAAAGVRNYITTIIIENTSATVSTEVTILDGATVLCRGLVGATTLSNNTLAFTFPVPLKGTAATAINAQCTTTGANVYVTAVGYTSI